MSLKRKMLAENVSKSGIEAYPSSQYRVSIQEDESTPDAEDRYNIRLFRSRNCCCCIPIVSGALTLSVLLILNSIVVLFMCIYGLATNYEKAIDYNSTVNGHIIKLHHNFQLCINCIDIGFSSVTIVVCLLVVYGIYARNHYFFWPAIVYGVIEIALRLIGVCVVAYYTKTMQLVDSANQMGTQLIIYSGTMMFVQLFKAFADVYFVWVVSQSRSLIMDKARRYGRRGPC